MYRHIIKPFLDVAAALVLLALTLPLSIGCFLFLLVVNKGSVFFIQKRPGMNEKIFSVMKFKTMTDVRDSAGNYLSDEERLTPIGRFIRRTSLDELPQLLNVIAGNMSLVGPRPLLSQYIPLYNQHQRRRHLVRPGITGWAQVNGRNAITWQQKFDFDVWYVDHQSFYIDLKILLLTALTVIKAKGIGDGLTSTMKNFEGNVNDD